GGEDGIVVLEEGDDEDAGGGAGGDDGADGVDAALAGELKVHQDDVGEEVEGDGDGLGAVRGLADELEVGDGGDQLAQPLAEEGMVFDDQDTETVHASCPPFVCPIGKVTRTSVPWLSGPEPMAQVPPNSVARSRIDWSPRPVASPVGVMPTPSSVTVSRRD